MKFSKLCKIHKAVARNARWSVTEHVLFDKTDGRLVACNGSILAVVPVTDTERDESGMIPTAALAEATKGKLGDAELASLNEHVATGNYRIDRPSADPEHYPDYKRIVTDPPAGLSIRLSAKHLIDLVAALGAVGTDLDMIELRFMATSQGAIDSAFPVRVDVEGTGAFGVIMPIKGG